MKAYREVEGGFHTFCDLTTHKGDWSASCSGHYTPGREPWYSLTSSTTNQNTAKNTNSLAPARIQNPDYLAYSLVSVLTILSQL
jgi:hypothetical protein